LPVTIYGIKTCDTVRKARAWLDAHGVAHCFVDYRAESLDPKLFDRWCRELGWETLLNRSSTSFRQLPDAEKTGIGPAEARSLMLRDPTLIKRPVLDVDGSLMVGFKPGFYERALAAAR
jgi:arsenate reductase